MNCGRFEKLIDSYHDGGLHGTLLAEFHAHRLHCRRCSRVVSMLEAAGDVIAQDRCEPTISADFADRVVAAMPAAQKADRSATLVRLMAGAAGVAAAASILLAVMVAGQVPAGPERHTAISGKVAIANDSGGQLPVGSQNVVHHVQRVSMTGEAADATRAPLLDGQIVRDAVDRFIWWEEADRTDR